MYKVYQNEL